MKTLKYRSDEPELMDDPKIDKKLISKNLGELDLLNRYTGGHAVTLQGVKTLIGENKIYTVVDLGCGSGDALKYLAKWGRKNSVKLKLIGVDNNIHAIQYLKRNCMGFPEISGIVMDYGEYLMNSPPTDIFMCNLFCHHLDNNSLLELFKALRKKARVGFVINDLQRSKISYYSVWFLTRLLNGSELAKNDGPVSVNKGFLREELEQLLVQSGHAYFSIQKKWAFRYLVVGRIN